MSSKTQKQAVNVTATFPFVTPLFLVLLVLKLTEVIDWSWWWITAPLWGSFALGIAFIVVVTIVVLISEYRKG